MSWIFIFLFSISAFAETELDVIEVKSTKDIEQFTFTNSEKISSKQLESQALGLAYPELEKVPGVVPNQNGGPGGRVSFFIRGTESRHVSFTLDGLKINDTSNTDRQFDAAFITSPPIREINVYKGPQAVLYGSDAMGGLIDMRTRKGENAPETRLTLNGGSFGTYGSTLANDWQSKTNNGTLTATQFHTDGISRLNKKRYNAKERDAADITQFTSSSEHRWARLLQTDLLVSYLHGKAEQDSFADDNSNDYSRNDQYILQQKTSYQINKSQILALRNGFNRHQRYNESILSNQEFFNGNLYQNELTHRVNFEEISLITGFATEHEDTKAIDLDRSFDLHSLFIQSAFNHGNLKFHAGGRMDKHTKYGTFFTGAVGAAYSEFSFQYSQGYKAPSLYQLYGPPSFGSPVGNPNLVPETNHYTELAWKRIRDSYEGAVTLFQNRLSNLFTYSFTSGYLNQQRFIAEGIELSGKIKLRKFDVLASMTHQNFRDEETTILRRPYNLAQVGVSYFPVETVELNINERWYSSRKDFGTTGITKLNGYEVTDISVRKVWANDDVTFQLRNLFNREYEDLFGFSVMPRSVFLNYGHRF